MFREYLWCILEWFKMTLDDILGHGWSELISVMYVNHYVGLTKSASVTSREE